MSHLSDKEILKLYRQGDNPDYAFNLLVKKYQEQLYALIRKIIIVHADADDVLQETFIKIYKSLDSFRSESELSSWMYRIAVNECLSHIRKEKRKYLFRSDSYQDHLINSMEADVQMDGDAIQKQLQNAILQLPEKQGLVFNLKYYENMKYDDMSEILNTSTGALKASYHHAVKKIEKYLNSV